MKYSLLLALSAIALQGCAHEPIDGRYASSCSFSLDGDQPLTFYVQGQQAILKGVVCDGSPGAFEDMYFDNPQVKTLVYQDIDGSADDEANTELGYMIREAGLDSIIYANGHIASGGTDLFLSGVSRSVELGAKIGVHSWSGGDIEGDELPRDHEEHRRYLDYYQQLGIDTDFYWFTLEAAPADGMYYMNRQELERFGFITP